MKKNKKFFTYKNKIILTDGASLKITSIKYIKNYQLNFKIFQKKKVNENLNNILNKNKLNFIKKISI
uniref:Ymf101 n=1 Tax=Phytopythium vexans TaxID=907947 RepID=UPI0020282204|nr:Ymf101 [Phytopythium vexans]YP_010395058.1 Ymf101 [Phytopythium vexans]DAZ89471.1 TPA_asm: Ymf101 [Phytopythium vexans]DAZ89495.1 TPA_asm: Ymf101 [Phytopythium vexans]